MKTSKTFIIIASAVFFFFSEVLLAVEWYNSYGKALESIRNQQWKAALEQLNAAIAEKSESQANAKIDQRVIDYFPYLYRGMAHYHLGDFAQAMKDLETEIGFSEMSRAASDRAANGTLQFYIHLVSRQLEWYIIYEKALESIEKQQWYAAMGQLYAALEKKSVSKANVKIEQRVIDYFPYLYRGIAHYHLGDVKQASNDLEKELDFGEVSQAATDKVANNKLQQYVELSRQSLAATKFNEALTFFNQKRYEAAKKGFEEVLKLDPNNIDAGKYLKSAEDELRQHQLAVMAELMKGEEEPFISYEKALESIEQQQWETAVKQLTTALAKKSESKANIKTNTQRLTDYFPYLYRGIAHYHLGNVEQARKDLEKELASSEVRLATTDKAASGKLQQYITFVKQRQLAAPKFNEALTFFNQKQYDSAKKGFVEVLKIDPNNAGATKYVKSMEDEAAKTALAKAEAEKKVELDKEFNSGAQAFGERNFDAAEKYFNRVLALDKAYPGATDYLEKIKGERVRARVETVFNEGVSLFEAADWNGAEAKFKAALKLDSTYAGVNRVLALDKTHPGAADYLERIKAERARVAVRAQIETVFNEGVSLFEASDWNGAEAKFNAILKLDSAYAGANDYLKRLAATRAETAKAFREGERLYKNQEWDRAEEAFLVVIRLNKNDARASSYLDKIAANRGVAATRQRAESLFNEGVTSFNNGDLKNAKTKFLNAQRLDSSQASVKERLNAIAQVEKSLRDGVAAFFEGAYDQAIAQLAEADRLVAVNAEAHAFWGCALAAKYYLSGEEDKALYKNALDQFSVVKRLDAKYKLDVNSISPKIVALFEEN